MPKRQAKEFSDAPTDPSWAYAEPLETVDISHWKHWKFDQQNAFFARLREEDPVHYQTHGHYGPFWSLTRYEDIKAVDGDHERFSSQDNIGISDAPPGSSSNSFISMDPPKHDAQRKTVAPVVAPRNLKAMEGLIRQRVGTLLDSLPLEEEFDWVETVSVELTTQMLATLFDFPFADRHKLTRWSDVATGGPETGVVETHEQRRVELAECLEYFTRLLNDRKDQEPRNDLVSMLAHGDATQDMDPQEFLGNITLLIVGGNDTTRNSMSGSVYALNKFPKEYDKLRANPDLIPNMVAEIIRWQTPLAHMRRTALTDVEVGGKTIRKGDKVVMWYLSGNRDETVFNNAEDLVIDRANARQHLSFGFGLHRCMGNRLAELQLRILWEEIATRFRHIEVLAEPERTTSNFIHGYTYMPVKLHSL